MTALATAGNARVVHWRGRTKATCGKARGRVTSLAGLTAGNR